jgi:type IV secretion system protein VirD4
MLLDEFANIGQIPKFDKLIATIRSREISACIILQAQSQLKSIYKDNAETIIGNCDTVLFLGGKEKTTLKDLSESLGKETVYMLTNNVSKGQSPSYSMNTQKLGKELMSIDEISVMDGGKCILQIRGERPFLSDKYDITKHKNYRHLSDANPKNVFNIERHVSTKLKVKPDEEYTYFEHTEVDEEMPQEAFDDFNDDFPEDLEPL